MISAVIVVCLAASYAAAKPEGVLVQTPESLSEEMVKYINAAGSTWEAHQYDRFSKMSLSDVKGMMGARLGMPDRIPRMTFPDAPDTIPATFDSREQWPNCPSIREIRDQGSCGSCWAIAAAEAMSDRLCIGRNLRVNISTENLASCCTSCGNGCNGGFPYSAWEYFQDTGLVTGGQYNSSSGCQPYTIPACDHHVHGHLAPCKAERPTPQCLHTCRPGYPKTYSADMIHGKSVYYVHSVRDIQLEIMARGPVETAFSVYADFVQYRTGVYQHVSGSFLGGHAVKIVGWGSENGVDYWLIANSWNSDWGMDGYFKIRRGADECGIENGVVAGKV